MAKTINVVEVNAPEPKPYAINPVLVGRLLGMWIILLGATALAEGARHLYLAGHPAVALFVGLLALRTVVASKTVKA